MKLFVCFLLLIISITLSSCMKDIDAIPPSNDKKSLDEIQVSAVFDWSTSKTITVEIVGLPTPNPIWSTLTIMLPDGSTLYQRYHNMADNLQLKLVLPVEQTEIQLKYGTETYILPVNEKKASFSFIPKVIDE